MNPSEKEKYLIAQEEELFYGKPLLNKLKVYHSFEEANEADHKESAALSFAERINYFEMLRKRVYFGQLDDHAKWPPLKRIITIIEGSFK